MSTLEQNLQTAQELFSAGKPRKAIGCCENILAQTPGNTVALVIKGKSHTRIGQLQKAHQSLNQALQNEPANPEILSEHGTVLLRSGHRNHAIPRLARAVFLKPEERAFKVALIQALPGVSFQQFDPDISTAIKYCLQTENINLRPLFWAWYSLLLHHPEMKILHTYMGHETYDDFLEKFELNALSPLLNHDFMVLGLGTCLIHDMKFERFMAHTRRALLLEATEKQREKLTPFLLSLAHQCFYGQYVFTADDQEEEKLGALEESDNPSDILLWACYKDLHTHKNIDNVLSILREIKHGEELCKLLILDPVEEQKIAQKITSVGSIQNEISEGVREQYEVHPYPRWIDYDELHVSEEKREASKNLNILIAGCGTGRQAVSVANNFPAADITGIDLSLASLSYAQRQTTLFGLQNLSFKQCDILEVSALEQKFDYIACGGVLHHMEAPEKGLEALRSVLKDDGVMRIALYSEIARKNIVAVQKWVEEHKFPHTDEGIRAFRRAFWDSTETTHLRQDGTLPGFFSMSECRDTYFHVQEHRFTCLQIKDMLEALDLELLVFGMNLPRAKQQYLKMFPAETTAVNLENWHKFEEAHPQIFLEMYQFIVCKEGAHEAGRLPAWLAAPGAYQ